ncbi:MAG: molecular chaperone DnaK [Candidatus Ranarchaeia archaeon]|jgi:molecular chaperone DnaK
MAKEKIIGIDLGTSNSQAAMMMGGKPTIIPSAEGTTVAGKMFPSFVAFTKDDQLLVGEPAKRQAVSNPDNTVRETKRKMGTTHKYTLQGKEYTPQQISAFILQKIKRDAEAFIGEPVKKAVITVPAYFNDNQRTATKDAGKIAGLDVVRLVSEPTAAAMAYGLGRTGEGKIMVFDLGGGTLDVTIMEYGDGTFNVISTAGDTQLGGSDMDRIVVDWIVKEFKKQEGVDLTKDKMATQRVLEAAEKAKIELSSVLETEINLPYITATQEGPKHLVLKLTQAKLEKLVYDIVEKCRPSVELALEDAKMSRDQIDKIILVGGPTRMPIIQKFLEEGVGKKVEKGVDPMECVAIGASIQAGILAGEVKGLVLLDVTPLTLGVETLGGVMTPLIERNTTIPTKHSKIFTTAGDMQTVVTVHALQGERPMAKDNTSLGQFNLEGIAPAPRGIPQIEVTFDIDANGIINVSAKDKATGKEQQITITASTKLSKEEVDQMVKSAEEHAEEDQQRLEQTQIQNDAENIVYTVERTISELGEKMPTDVKGELTMEVKVLKDLMEAPEKDFEKIKAQTEKVTKVIQKAGASVYQQPEGGVPPGPDTPPPPPKDDKEI